ncbi:MAG: TrkH family potassium uptake protein [Bacteroidales bacterium]|jgi:trk system potassium uptake protein TrkH|nr:TrkH family potassium uptake protein [Bacteroidales bacterium]
MNIRFILYILGALMIVEGFLMLFPTVVAMIYGEPDMKSFLFSSLITGGTGGIFRYLFRETSKEITKREGHIIVCLVWIVFGFFGSLPFLFGGQAVSLADAFFETISGLTTTGCSVMPDVESLTHGLLFWRALMHFMGGVGILMLVIAVLPIFGVGSMTIYQVETSQASISRLSPRIKDTAGFIFRIYLFLTFSCLLAYLPEMNFFDAVCHAFSTTASGGFSTRNAGMGAFSAYSQYISVIFMLLAGTNFVLMHYVRKGDFKKATQSDEFRFYLLMVLSVSLFVATGLLLSESFGVERAFREGLFHVVSICSTTGYTVSDYTLWFPPLWFVITLTALVGGCAGSTAGGLKMVRIILLLRMIPVQFKRIMHHRGMILVKLNRQNVPEEQMFRTLSFLMIFLCVFILGVFVLMICGLDVTTAFGATVACLTNCGQGLGEVGPSGNFSGIPVAGKWVCSFLMLLGRLELYAVLIIFSRDFWNRQG